MVERIERMKDVDGLPKFVFTLYLYIVSIYAGLCVVCGMETCMCVVGWGSGFHNVCVRMCRLGVIRGRIVKIY